MSRHIEIKAQCLDLNKVREILKKHQGEHKSTEYQTDTYLNSNNGFLKLREGNTENKLIHYEKEATDAHSENSFTQYKVEKSSNLKTILESALGSKCVVEKERETFLIKNITFHLDTVKNLGTFIKIKASNKNSDLTKDELEKQCNFYIKELQLNTNDFISTSYFDMIQRNNLFSQILIEED